MFIQGFDIADTKIDEAINDKNSHQQMIVGTNGYYMNQFYHRTSKTPIKGIKIPNPRFFISYEKYTLAFVVYENSSSNLYKHSLLPIPVSALLYKPPNPPLLVKIPEYKARVNVPPENLSYLTDVCISGTRFVSKASLPALLGGRFEAPISTIIDPNPKWNSQLITHPPVPECYDKFEDFKQSSLTWYNSVSTSSNHLPNHPDSMKEFIQPQPVKPSKPFNPPTLKPHKPFKPANDQTALFGQNNSCPSSIDQLKALIDNDNESNKEPNYGPVFKFNEKVTFDHLTQTPTDVIQDLCDYGSEDPINNFDIIMKTKQAFNIPDKIFIDFDPGNPEFVIYLENVFVSRSPYLNYQCFLVVENLLLTSTKEFMTILSNNLRMFYYITVIVSMYTHNSYVVVKPSNFSSSEHAKDLNEFQKILLHHHYLTIIAKTFISCLQISSNIGCYLASTQGELWDYLKGFDKNISLMLLESNTTDLASSLFRLLLVIPCPYIKRLLSCCNQDMFRYLNILSSKSPTHFNALVYIIYNSKSMNIWFLEEFTFFAKSPKFSTFNPNFIAFIKTLLKYFQAERLEDFSWLSPFYMFSLQNNFISLLPYISKFVKKYQIENPEVERHIHQMILNTANEISLGNIDPNVLISFASLLKYKTSLKNVLNLVPLIEPLNKYLNDNNEEIVHSVWKVFTCAAIGYPKKFFELVKLHKSNGKMIEVYKRFNPISFFEFAKMVEKIAKEDEIGNSKQRRKSFGFIGTIQNKILKVLEKGIKKANVQYNQLIGCMNRKNQPIAQNAMDLLFLK
ncbi:hypothetical protein GPJ56_007572 [Histomonas meleagridis]|uniref:uncharacterized protein n=1 Tax=Histomonas meleagridis TaxID=135588 RepID=UPI0035598DB7|nr:hypothetical protein GPJ56_007572 [Histomonas meleagridis]KAH0806091.1 hypothetical protein GO595_001104 [Histomonas meleagridis]